MNRLLAILTATVMLFTVVGCSAPTVSPNDIISGVGYIDFEESESQEDSYAEEFPDAESDVEGSSSQAPSSSSEASSSSSVSQSQSSSSSSQSAGSSSSSSAGSSKEEDEDDSEDAWTGNNGVDAMSAVWISYLELAPWLQGKSESQFTRTVETTFGKIADAGLNTVIVQVRPFGDALYSSSIFPWSYICTGTEGKNPGYDPLEIMIRVARKKGLSIDAWLNPYRVRAKGNTKKLSDDNQAAIWLDEGSDAVVRYDGGIYYNPGVEEARQLIVDGVLELIENYDVDGVHFDDYFYPGPDKSFDADTYANAGTNLSLANWRRENVNILVRDVYSTVKGYNRSVRFGISPQGNNDVNYSNQYIDVKEWVTNTGYVDYICPQVYWGFDHSTKPFARTVKEWNSMITQSKVDLVVGIGAYRLGEGGEWNNTTDILARMVKESRKQSRYGGFALYRSDFLFGSSVTSQAATELKNLSKLLF